MLNPSTRLLNSIIHPAESRPLFHKRPALRVLLDFDYFFTNVSAPINFHYHQHLGVLYFVLDRVDRV